MTANKGMTRNQIRRKLMRIQQSNFDKANNTYPEFGDELRNIYKDLAFLTKIIDIIYKKVFEAEKIETKIELHIPEIKE